MTQITAVAFVVTRKDDDDDFRGNRKAPKKLWSLPQVFQVKLIGSGFVTFFRSRTKSFSSWLWLQASLNKKVTQDLTGGNKIWKSDRKWPTWLFELQDQSPLVIILIQGSVSFLFFMFMKIYFINDRLFWAAGLGSNLDWKFPPGDVFKAD